MKYAMNGRALSETLNPGTPKTLDYPIIVHSHLNWDWVWQRPQQLLSRLAERHHILFVEEPKFESAAASSTLQMREVADFPNILVLQMSFPAARAEDSDWLDQERRRLLQTFLAEPIGANFQQPVQWFYDPMAVTAFAGQMKER